MESRKQELQKELNDIRAKEVETKLLEMEGLESSASAIQKIEQAKAKAELDISCAKSEAQLKIDTSRSENSHKRMESMTHRFVTIGDFLLKFGIATAISISFIYIVYTGSIESLQEEFYPAATQSDTLFSLLSVVGPLFGMVLSYYFGKSKSSVNGE